MTAAAAAADTLLVQLRDRLTSLEGHCLANLETGIGALVNGDHTVAAIPVTRPIDADSDDPLVAELGEIFNRMLARAQAAVEGYNQLRDQLAAVLGDHSVLEDLSSRLHSLHDHCLTNLNVGLSAMSDGDLTIEVTPVTTPIVRAPGESIGEFGELFNAMLAKAQSSLVGYEAMRATLSAVISEIRSTSVTVAAASTQMAATSEEASRAVGEIANAVSDVAEGAERQVRSVDDAKLMAERVAAASQASAENAQQTSRAAGEAREAANEGAGAVGRASETMQAVQESSNEVSEVIRTLGSKSADIGGIAATITGIAQQTNLLALNAAIEAARAGDQGRGFAVVAEEVRKLAEESQRAAADIGHLSQEIQKETARAVTVVDTGARRTQEGVAVVEQARSSFEKINESVTSMVQRVDEISEAAQGIAANSQLMHSSMDEVASVAEQSSAATEEVSAATEQTSASAQQIAASAQQLASTAEELERLVGRFALA